jgi:VIT1/CCC1 family predicted Fe2+/Mn2+ transporter
MDLFKNNNSRKYFSSRDAVHDIIIGMSDGLTVPFALAAGISSTVSHTSVIVVAGISAIIAGCISMGLGGYLAARNDVEYYYNKLEKEHNDVKGDPTEEIKEVVDIFIDYGLTQKEIDPVMEKFENNPEQWVKFMIRNELELSKPYKGRALNSGLTVAISYLISGFIPLFPYFFVQIPYKALLISIIVTFIALVVFGYMKAKVVKSNVWQSIFNVVLISGLAASIAFIIGKLIV